MLIYLVQFTALKGAHPALPKKCRWMDNTDFHRCYPLRDSIVSDFLGKAGSSPFFRSIFVL
jgi:hypothetical protein